MSSLPQSHRYITDTVLAVCLYYNRMLLLLRLEYHDTQTVIMCVYDLESHHSTTQHSKLSASLHVYLWTRFNLLNKALCDH